MEYKESEPAGFKEDELAEGVEVRIKTVRGLAYYAVFDEEEQVSEELAGAGADPLADWVQGYSEAKRRYSDG